MKLSPTEIGIVVLIIFVLFGGTLIPKIMKRVKSSAKTLKTEMDDLSAELENNKEETVEA